MDYNFKEIESKWQAYWAANHTFKADINNSKPKYYVLDMFPYPSGAGLHVGHPLGYIASDIYSRYKRLCGFNVLHPMGYDAFGLPAENFAIKTGIHPRVVTDNNIKMLGFMRKNIKTAFDQIYDDAIVMELSAIEPFEYTYDALKSWKYQFSNANYRLNMSQAWLLLIDEKQNKLFELEEIYNSLPD